MMLLPKLKWIPFVQEPVGLFWMEQNTIFSVSVVFQKFYMSMKVVNFREKMHLEKNGQQQRSKNTGTNKSTQYENH